MTAAIRRLFDAVIDPLAREVERLPPQALRHFFGAF